MMVDFKKQISTGGTSHYRIAPPNNTHKPYEAACLAMRQIIEAWHNKDKESLYELTYLWMLFYHNSEESESNRRDCLPNETLVMFGDFVRSVQAWGWGLNRTEITIEQTQAVLKRINELENIEKQLVQVWY